jgi:hypothetical protein
MSLFQNSGKPVRRREWELWNAGSVPHTGVLPGDCGAIMGAKNAGTDFEIDSYNYRII